ncbi:MAG TPA: type II secretion system protein [Phycisphaerales bacterium]|nr:type II secretion system protein [Phycisphaerales bacterium]
MIGGHDPFTRTRARRGFTLVELVLVVIILGIVGAIAVPRFAGANVRYRADAAAAMIADTLREASFAARSRSDAVTCTIDETEETIKASVDRTGEGIIGLSVDEQPYYADIQNTWSVDGAPSLAVDGMGEFAQSFLIRVAVAGETRDIMLDAATGRITVGETSQGDTFAASESLK